MDYGNFNMDFMRRAEKVTRLNFRVDDVQTLDYKKEIQFLITKYFFPNFDIARYTTSRIDKESLNKGIKALKARGFRDFELLHSYPLSGVGPAEMTLFYLCSSAYLGGGASKGVDIFANGKKYEVKASVVSGDGKFVHQFKLGGTVILSDIISNARELAIAAGHTVSGNEISGTIIDDTKAKFPEDWEAQVDKPYRDRAASYFKDQTAIFINNNKQDPKAKNVPKAGAKTAELGEIVAIKKVKKEDIFLGQITSNTIKPKVKI